MGNWLLPESLADVLPAEARRIEELRRELLDLYRTYGFELVAPPLVEYIDSLLSGTGSDLDLRTCKLVDQLSGRTLGVRADLTPQVTRIDAHLLNRAGVTRLCYCGNVLHARPADLLSSRELLQIGGRDLRSCRFRSRPGDHPARAGNRRDRRCAQSPVGSLPSRRAARRPGIGSGGRCVVARGHPPHARQGRARIGRAGGACAGHAPGNAEGAAAAA